MSGQSSKSLEALVAKAGGRNGGSPGTSTGTPQGIYKARITANNVNGVHSIELVSDDEVDSGITFDYVSDYTAGDTVYAVNSIVAVFFKANERHPYIFSSGSGGGGSGDYVFLISGLMFFTS